jgi:putative ABC transport system ATP-binding protein
MPAGESNIIIKAESVTRSVTKNGSPFNTIDSFSYSFENKKIYNILGPSGSGKSSLLRLINRLDNPNSGRLYLNGRDYIEYNPLELRRKVSLLFQVPFLFPGTVKDNLKYCCPLEDRSAAAFHLKRVGLKEEMVDTDVENLSVGEMQRVALARSLTLEPEVLLLDEPTSALDPTATQKIEELIIGLANDMSLTVIMVSHNPNQALRIGGETLLLVAGRLAECGKTEEVLTVPKSEEGKKYINRELI